MSNDHGNTYFIDTNGEKLGDVSGVLSSTLYKGMKITIHGYSEEFTVVDWNYHYGHPDEQAGLRVVLKR